MKYFLAGVLVTIFVPLVAAFIFFKLGLMAVNADAQPGWFEKHVANVSLDAAVNRNAPRQDNPIPGGEETLAKGVKLYKEHCAACHGGPEGSSDLGLSFYPPAPQFVNRKRPLEDPDGNLFYVIKHGVRLTGMPSFGSQTRPLLKDDEIWTLVRFIKAILSLPPSVMDVWKAKDAPAPNSGPSPGASPVPGVSASSGAHQHHRHLNSPTSTVSPTAGGLPGAASPAASESASPAADEDEDNK